MKQSIVRILTVGLILGAASGFSISMASADSMLYRPYDSFKSF